MEKPQQLVPDLGGASDVDVIEILVNVGDRVVVDEPLVTLEGDKASMEVPATKTGVISAILVKVGDKVNEGDVVCEFSLVDDAATDTSTKTSAAEPAASAPAPVPAAAAASVSVCIPDIGGAEQVDVIEVLVAVGDEIAVEQPLLTLEGDKATMEVPATVAGTVQSLAVAVGDKVSEGSVIAVVSSTAAVATASATTPTDTSTPTTSADASEQAPAAVASSTPASAAAPATTLVHASPAVRRIATELAVDLTCVPPTGAKGRITKADVKAYLQRGSGGASAGAAGIAVAAAPAVDFSQFGEISTTPLNKIKKLSGANLHRNWVSIPHVTQFDEADVTAMEAFRQSQKEAAKQQGVKLTPIVFIMKAVVAALKAFPHFNASLDSTGEQLVLKNYFHIGVAVDTPNGLVVPVIRDVDKKSLFTLAEELGAVSLRAREKGLGLKDMQGGCFTISSLGGIGGTAFTPIINAPEVAILGLSRTQKKPVYDADGQLSGRLMLPLSLSYDHRVIDGAEGARFMVYLASRLADIRTLLL